MCNTKIWLYFIWTISDATCDYSAELKGSSQVCFGGEQCYNMITDKCDGFIDCLADGKPADEEDCSGNLYIRPRVPTNF